VFITSSLNIPMGRWGRVINIKSPSWSPLKLSGCVLYLDSSMGVTLSSGYVSQWADQSGNGRHASQSTAAYRPLYVTNVLNGRPALRFDGSDDYLTFNASGMPSGSSPRTAIFVVKRTDTSRRGDVFSYRDTDTLYHAWGVTLDSGVLGDNDIFGNYWGVSIGQGGIADTNPMIISTTLPSTNVYSTRLWKNGTELTKSYHGNVDGTAATGTSQASIGVTTGLISDTAFKGDILFFAIYNRALSDAERQKVERWLGARYGITVA